MNNEVGSEFVMDDITHYVEAYAKFGIDITELIQDRGYTKFQVPVETLDNYIEHELSADALHQLEWWIIKDRAFEAFGIIESDGHSFALDGKLLSYHKRYESIRSKRGAFINLVKGNRDRMVAQLETSNFEIGITANFEKDVKTVEDLNEYKRNVLDDNNFDAVHSGFIRDGVTFGSGFFSVDYGRWKTNPELNQYIRRINQGETLSLDDFYRFKRAVKGHKIEYVNTFEMIRCRHARGEESVDINHRSHRWLHRVEQISVAEAMLAYPQYADMIGSRTNQYFADTNPYGYFQDQNANVTLKHTWIKFGTIQVKDVRVQAPDGGDDLVFPIPIERHAIGKVTRLEGVGVVDMKIDHYDHNSFPFVMWVYAPSHAHSCGIGLVKYGRDPQVLWNQLHNGMLEYFGRMAKGGGFFDSRMGITEQDISDMSKPGTWKKIKMNAELGERPIKDYFVENRPPTFPSVYNDLMSIERTAVDESMNVPNVSKGIRSGDSGKQELILQQQADMAHSATISMLGMCYFQFAKILYSNIIQFDTDPFTFVTTNPVTGQRETIAMNMPEDYYLKWDNDVGDVVPVPYNEVNNIRNIMFAVKIDKNNVVPSKPSEKAQFYVNFFSQTAQYINDPKTRIWLEEMNKNGLRLPGITKAIQLIDEMDAKAAEANAQAVQAEKEAEQFEKDREYTLELMDVLAKIEKNQAELSAKVNSMMPTTTQ